MTVTISLYKCKISDPSGSQIAEQSDNKFGCFYFSIVFRRVGGEIRGDWCGGSE